MSRNFETRAEQERVKEDVPVLPRMINKIELGTALIKNERYLRFAMAEAMQTGDSTGLFLVKKLDELRFIFAQNLDSASRNIIPGDRRSLDMQAMSAELIWETKERGILGELQIATEDRAIDAVRLTMKREINNGGSEQIMYDIGDYENAKHGASADLSSLVILKY